MTDHEYLVKSTIFRIYNPTTVFVKYGRGICDCKGFIILEGKHRLYLDINGGEWVDIEEVKLILRSGRFTNTIETHWNLINQGYSIPVSVPGENGAIQMVNPIDIPDLVVLKTE